MRLEKLDLGNGEHCNFVKELYTASFPPSERRPIESMFKLYREDNPFCVKMIISGEKPVGFITHWNFERFIYAEHFAISPLVRNGGYGKKTLQDFVNSLDKPVVLEVEYPTDEMSTRRIGFYTRLGFKLWSEVDDYVQPSFVRGEDGVPMYLLSYGELGSEKDVRNASKTLFEEIYDKQL